MIMTSLVVIKKPWIGIPRPHGIQGIFAIEHCTLDVRASIHLYQATDVAAMDLRSELLAEHKAWPDVAEGQVFATSGTC